ncbi:MAG: Arc family DNA-binding protein, partial [Pseudomonadales bacterium]|nr:Arc family DNA-binding protein [Pseudomonadales bacterium]
MRRRIADAARTYHRSMNSEIVARLEHSLDTGAEQYPEPVTGDRNAEDALQEGNAPDSHEELRLIAIYRRMSPERRR